MKSLKKCSYCQNKNNPNAKFCENCGEPFIKEIEQIDSQKDDLGWQINSDKKNTTEQPKLDSKKKIESKFKNFSNKTYARNKNRNIKKFSNVQVIATIIFTVLFLWFVSATRLNLPILVFWIVIILVIWLFPRIKKKIKDKSSQNEELFLQGEVRGFAIRVENKLSYEIADTIWTFRLERYFKGQQLPPIPVEMRGKKFEGFINEGDTIKLLSDWKEGLHKTKEVFNLTNNTLVKAKRGTSIWLINFIAIAIVIIFFLLLSSFL